MKGKAKGLILCIAMVAILGGMVLMTDWNEEGLGDEPGSVPFTPSEDTDFTDTLNYALFEEYGPVILVVTMLLFGAIIGAACIAQEKEDEK